MSAQSPGAGVKAGTFRGAGWTPRLVLSLLSIVLLIEAVTLSYVKATTALPFIGGHFQTPHSAWILTTYALAGAISAPLFGKLADKYGKRRMLITVMVLAFTGSVLAATAQTFAMLLVGRALEGCLIGAMFLTYSLVRDTYPPKIVPFAASITVTGAGVFALFVPTLVGVIIDAFGWRAVFTLSAIWVGVMIFAIIATTDESPVRAQSKIDGLGVVLFGGAIGTTLVGVSMGNTWGWTSFSTLGLIALGLALLAVYAFTALHKKDPILNIRMFTRRGILIATMSAIVMYGVQPVVLTVISIIGLTPAALGGGYGLGLSATGLAQITTTTSITSVIAGFTIGVVVRKIGPWNTARAGMVMIALGAAYIAFRHNSVPDLILGCLIAGFGGGACSASVPNLVIQSSPAKDQASFSSGIQVIISGIGAITPVLAFVVLGQSATVGAGNAIVYTDSAITTVLLGCVALAVVSFIIVSTVLRPRSDTLRDVTAEPTPDDLVGAE